MTKKTRAFILIAILVLTLCFALLKNALFTPKTLSEEKVIVRIEQNESIHSVSTKLEEQGVVGSGRLLRLYLSWREYDTKLAQGEFHFVSPISLREVAIRLTQRPAKPLYVVTVPEGSDDSEVASFFAKKNTKLSPDIFLKEIEKRGASGFLFPDTYFLSGKESEEEVIEKMLVNFRTKYSSKETSNTTSYESMLTNKDIQRHLSIASILEGEANTEYDMRVVAGILLKREKIGMRLQVDVARETYSSYGFPEKPINNPGLISLKAAENPVETPYLYYITGNDGKMYYAKTFAEHKKNIVKHL